MIEPATLDTLIGVLYGAAIVLIGALVSLALAWIASLRRKLDANTELTQEMHDKMFAIRRAPRRGSEVDDDAA